MRRESSRWSRRGNAARRSSSRAVVDTATLHNLAREDHDEHKTWTRILVEKHLSKFKWYFPLRDKVGGPQLSEAYAFYEHVTLPRHFLGNDDRAEPGEAIEPTLLYDPMTTSSNSFLEWGIGIDCYFSTLKMIVAVMFVAGLINVPNMLYYASTDYSENGQASVQSFFLVGSALCTTFEWAVCRNCLAEDFSHDIEQKARLGFAPDGTVLVERNACHGARFEQGMVNYATFFFLLISMAFISYYQNAREVKADEDKLTASDYSVVVRNPPPDAYDPNEWRTFFAQFAQKQVTAVTVALDNDMMLRKLTTRRIQLNTLKQMLPAGIDMDNDSQVLQAVEDLTREEESEMSTFTRHIANPFFVFAGLVVPARTLYNNAKVLAEEFRELQKKKYKVANVFITFETEQGQRNALQALSVGKFDIWSNNVQGNAPRFRDRVLFVEEPLEPDSVRWLDLSSTYYTRVGSWVFSLLVTLASVLIAGVCVALTRNYYGPYTAGILVSVFNSIIPQIVSVLMSYEPHLDEDSYETSLYMKITLFRWINTAVLIKLITPVTGNLASGAEDILPSINAILVSELFTTPILNLMDISSNINKHIYAPRARTQQQMNHYFLGTFYNIGERYTSLTNILFVCFFYAALFPATFFFGAAILLSQHYVDKFSLLRIWAWRPTVGSQLARFSRRYFFYGSLLAFFVVSSYAWAQFPYDNVCEPVDATSGHARDYRNVQLLNGTIMECVSVASDTDVEFCGQSWRDSDIFPFPPTSRLEPDDAKYMTDSQRKLVDTYGWTSLVALVAFTVLVFGVDFVKFVQSFFRGTYSPVGAQQEVDYSSNAEIYGYVPQIRLPSLPFPLLACDVDDIFQGLIGWNDTNNSYDAHNMIFDVPWEGMKRRTRISGNTRNTGQINDQSEYAESAMTESSRLISESNPVFSIIRHYPPSWLRKIIESQKEKPRTEANEVAKVKGVSISDTKSQKSSWWNPI